MDMCGHFIVKAIFFQLIEDYRINKPGTEVWFVLSSWYYTSEFNKLQLRIKVRIVIALTSFMAWHDYSCTHFKNLFNRLNLTVGCDCLTIALFFQCGRTRHNNKLCSN